MPRFRRVTSLVAGPGGGSGVAVEDDLKLAFDISKSDSKNPNRSTIQVWNMRAETRAMLERKGVRCTLKLGYAEEGGPVEAFQGDVTFAWSSFDLPNIVTTLELGEGAQAIRDTVVSLGYPKGAKSKTVVEDLAQRMGLGLHMPDDVPEREWNNGLSFHGPARSAMDRVVQGTGLAWSIQNGMLQVIRAGGTTNRTVVDLGAENGLIGAPERERKDAQQSAATVTDDATKAKRRVRSETQEVDGWRVKSLILPTVVPGDRVKLSSRAVQGVFTVKELRHYGDNWDGDFFTELKLIDPSAAASDKRGSTPAGKTRARQTPARPAPILGGAGGAGL